MSLRLLHHRAWGESGRVRWTYSRNVSLLYISPAIAADGTVYVVYSDGVLCALKGDGGPANTPWPMAQQNAARTGKR